MPPLLSNMSLRVGAAIVAAVYLGSTQVWAGFDYYVDSVNGSDANTGTSPDQAFASLSALPALSTGTRIALARGSYWREGIGGYGTSASDVVIDAYGTGAMPVLDCADVATGWTKTAGYTNVYQITWTYPAASTGHFLSLWEDGARLRWINGLAALDAAPGRYYVTTTDGSGTATVYLHATGSADPAFSGGLYEISRRMWAVFNDTGTGWIVSNLRTRRQLHNDGSLVLSGGNSVAKFCVAEDGTKHNLFLGANCEAQDCIAWKADWPDRTNATMFVGFAGDGAGVSAAFRRCVAIYDSAARLSEALSVGAVDGFYAHTAGAAGQNFAEVIYEDCAAKWCALGYGAKDANQLTVTRWHSVGCSADMSADTVAATIADPWCEEADGIVNHAGFTGYGSVVAVIDGLRHYSKNGGNYATAYTTSADVTLTHSVIVRGTPASGWKFVARGGTAGSAVSMDHCIVAGNAETVGYYREGSGTADYNVYTPAEIDFHIGSTGYSSWSAYRAAHPELDANSVQADPLLVDPANGDFSVQAGSPAIALGAGLLRPDAVYIPIPSVAAIAAM